MNEVKTLIVLPILIVFSVFIVGIVPDDHMFIQENTYLFAGTGVMLCILFSLMISGKIPSIKITVNFLDISVILFVMYAIIRIDHFTDTNIFNSSAWSYLLLLPVYFLLKTIFALNTGNADSFRIFTLGVTSLLLFQLLYGGLQYIGVLPVAIGVFSLEGTFLNPGCYANFLATCFPVSLGGFLFLNLSRREKYFVATTIVLFVVILPLTKARAAWLATFVATAMLLSARFELKSVVLNILNTRIKRIVALAATLTISVCICWLLISMKQDSASGRLLIWKIAAGIIADYPLWGTGTDSYAAIFSDYQMNFFRNNQTGFDEQKLAGNAFSAFNEYIEFSIELGLTGLFLFMTIIVQAISPGRQKNMPAIELPVRAALIALSITAFFSYPFQLISALLIMFMLLGIRSSFKQQPMLQFHISGLKLKVLSLAMIIPGIVLIIASYDFFVDCKTWKETSLSVMRMKNISPQEVNIVLNNAGKEYARLHEQLNKNYFFLYNYGTFLNDIGKHAESAAVLTKVYTKKKDDDLLVTLGDICVKQQDYDSAEMWYQKASYLIPHLYVPRYKLFKLYTHTGRKDLSDSVATVIYSMNTKIYTPEVGRIKLEMKEYLSIK